MDSRSLEALSLYCRISLRYVRDGFEGFWCLKELSMA